MSCRGVNVAGRWMHVWLLGKYGYGYVSFILGRVCVFMGESAGNDNVCVCVCVCAFYVVDVAKYGVVSFGCVRLGVLG